MKSVIKSFRHVLDDFVSIINFFLYLYYVFSIWRSWFAAKDNVGGLMPLLLSVIGCLLEIRRGLRSSLEGTVPSPFIWLVNIAGARGFL